MRHHQVIILLPVYCDWVCASMVCRALDEQLARLPAVRAEIVLVDDGSPDGMAGWAPFPWRSITEITVVRLRANWGHQRAICAGLCHVYKNMSCDWVVVMDADGEDRPEDAVRLIDMATSKGTDVLFAKRRKRLEGAVFQAGYILFRVLHRILTGFPVRVGNFSVISGSVVSRLVSMPELWNHYAGAIFKSRLAFESVPIDRGTRLHGHSRMNLVSLVMHGLAGIATFHETVATRILLSNMIGFAALSVVLTLIIAIRVGTDLAVPGWATYSAGLVLVLSTQLVGLSFSLVFSLIAGRTRMMFIPVRDYAILVHDTRSLPVPPAGGRADLE